MNLHYVDYVYELTTADKTQLLSTSTEVSEVTIPLEFPSSKQAELDKDHALSLLSSESDSEPGDLLV